MAIERQYGGSTSDAARNIGASSLAFQCVQGELSSRKQWVPYFEVEDAKGRWPREE